MSEETVTFNLEINVEQTLSQIRQLEGVLYRALGLIRRLGLPEDVSASIYQIQRMIMTIRLLHSALIALESGTTFGLVRGLLAGASALFSIGEQIDYEMRGR